MFAFNLSAPEFSAPELNAPRPCAHASNCYYNGPNGCAFVHPGEEGTGMKIFHARVVRENGKETWQKATVRLIGGAAFYERRRLKMSWPQWCALPKNAHLPKPGKAQLAPAAEPLAPATEPLTPAQPTLTPSVARLFQMAAAETVPFSSLSPVEQWRAMFQTGYAIQTPEIVAARANFMASFSEQARALNEKAIAEMKRQQIGNALYAIIAPFLAETMEAMKEGGVWHDKITAGKLTGMLLEGFSYEELTVMLSDMDDLKDRLAECCVLIKAANP
jgi:hypothetical protein